MTTFAGIKVQKQSLWLFEIYWILGHFQAMRRLPIVNKIWMVVKMSTKKSKLRDRFRPVALKFCTVNKSCKLKSILAPEIRLNPMAVIVIEVKSQG